MLATVFAAAMAPHHYTETPQETMKELAIVGTLVSGLLHPSQWNSGGPTYPSEKKKWRRYVRRLHRHLFQSARVRLVIQLLSWYAFLVPG
jgi:hypothetical protein